jgi:hypothetical protein
MTPMARNRSFLARYRAVLFFVLAFLIAPAIFLASNAQHAMHQRKLPASENTIGQDMSYPVFGADSFWYQKIPKDVVLHENSSQYAQEFARQVRSYYGHIGISLNNYSSPVYTVGPDVPAVAVSLWDCWGNGFRDKKLEADFAAVPIPPYAQPAGGTDAEMSIYQPTTGLLWEFWHARKVAGSWQACWGGRMSGISDNPGIWPHPYGAAATGLPFAPGQILVEELRRGEIRHVLGISIVDAEANDYSWPANRTDGWNPKREPNRILEGSRLRLDPSIDLDSLHLHPVAKTIARAAQIYGFVVWDRAGSVSLRAENPLRYTAIGRRDPYKSLFGGTPGYKLMDGFPWDKMQFLPANYGRPK